MHIGFSVLLRQWRQLSSSPLYICLKLRGKIWAGDKILIVFWVWKRLCREYVEWEERRFGDSSWNNFYIYKSGEGDRTQKGKPVREAEHLEEECNILVMKRRKTPPKAGWGTVITAKSSSKINTENMHSIWRYGGFSVTNSIPIIHGFLTCEFKYSLIFICKQPYPRINICNAFTVICRYGQRGKNKW